LWKGATGRPHRVLRLDKRVRAAAFSHDGTTVVTGGDDWDVTLWDAESGRAVAHLDAFSQVRAVAFDDRGATVLLGVEDSGAAYLWEARARAAWAKASRRLQEKAGDPGSPSAASRSSMPLLALPSHHSSSTSKPSRVRPQSAFSMAANVPGLPS